MGLRRANGLTVLCASSHSQNKTTREKKTNAMRLEKIEPGCCEFEVRSISLWSLTFTDICRQPIFPLWCLLPRSFGWKVLLFLLLSLLLDFLFALIELKAKIEKISKVIEARGYPQYLIQYRQSHEKEYARLEDDFRRGQSSRLGFHFMFPS